MNGRTVFSCSVFLTAILIGQVALAGGQLSGTVFQDFNGDGLVSNSDAVTSQAVDLHVAGVTVSVFDTNNVQQGQTTSVRCTGVGVPVALCTGKDTGPNYFLASIGGTGPYRVEFTWDSGVGSALEGFFPSSTSKPSEGSTISGQAASSVQFISEGGATDVNLGINRANDFCQNEPEIAVPVYQYGDQVQGPLKGEAGLIAVPFDAGSSDYTQTQPASVYRTPLIPPLTVPVSNVGTVFGLAYQRSSKTIYSSALYKRHAGFGPQGPGAIYRTDRASGATSLFMDLNSPDYLNGALGTDNHPTTFSTSLCVPPGPVDPSVQDCWFYDSDTFDQAGYEGLGDLDISESEDTLYVTNLSQRKVLQIPIGSSGVAPNLTSIKQFPVDGNLTVLPDIKGNPSSPDDCPNLSTDIRPFGLGIHKGRVFVGLVCSGESTRGAPGSATAAYGDRSKMWIYVYSFDPKGPGTAATFKRELRAKVDSLGINPYFPWWRRSHFADIYAVDTDLTQDQPIVSGIEFDGDDILVGVRSRQGDAQGTYAGPPELIPAIAFSGASDGLVIRACFNGTSYELESNGSCGGVSTSGVNDTYGLDGGSFYPHSQLRGAAPGFGGIAHGAVGASILQVPGFRNLLTSGSDVYDVFDGGLVQLNNRTGNRERTYLAFQTNGGFATGTSVSTFSKVNGLGDMVALCDAAPLEIGNRVWLDANKNGSQDAGESGISGVAVTLRSCGSTVPIATVITNSVGEYYFSSALGTQTTSAAYGLSLQEKSCYTISLDNAANYISGAALGNMVLTTTNASFRSNADAVDNDASLVDGFPVISLTTGTAGQNAHIYDFGFQALGPTPTSTATVPPEATSTPSVVTPSPSVTPTPGSLQTPTPIISATPTFPTPPESESQSNTLLQLDGNGFAIQQLGLQALRVRANERSCGALSPKARAALRSALVADFQNAWSTIWSLPQEVFISGGACPVDVAAIKGKVETLTTKLARNVTKTILGQRCLARNKRARAIMKEVNRLEGETSQLLSVYPATVNTCALSKGS